MEHILNPFGATPRSGQTWCILRNKQKPVSKMSISLLQTSSLPLCNAYRYLMHQLSRRSSQVSQLSSTSTILDDISPKLLLGRHRSCRRGSSKDRTTVISDLNVTHSLLFNAAFTSHQRTTPHHKAMDTAKGRK